MSVGWVAAGATAVSGLAGASASKSAARAQEKAGAAANGMSQAQFDQTRADNLPFLMNGTGANNQLAYLLGLSKTPGSSAPSLGNAQLVTASGGKNDALYNTNEAYRRAWDDLYDKHYQQFGAGYDYRSNMSWIENNLRSALAGDIEKEKAALAAQEAKAPNDPLYGSLTRKFGQSDLDNDVVYQTGLQFGLDEGVKGINRLAAATGGTQNGKTLKALTRFGNDYGSTKANESYNRFVNDQSNLFNRYAGLSGGGQQAVNQVSAAGANNAQTQGNNLIGMGNARAASAIGQANAVTGAISSGFNNYQQNKLYNSLGGGGGLELPAWKPWAQS